MEWGPVEMHRDYVHRPGMLVHGGGSNDRRAILTGHES